MSRQDDDDRDILLRSELPDIRHIAEVILKGHEFSTAAGIPYDGWSEPVVHALAERILTMVDALERRDPLAPPGSRTERVHVGARAAIELLSDGKRHSARDVRQAICEALGLRGVFHVNKYIQHANAYLLKPAQRIKTQLGGRAYLMSVSEEQ